MSVSDRVLALLHLVPYSEIKTSFWVREGMLLSSMTDFTINTHRFYSLVSHVQIDFCDSCQVFAIHPWGNSSALNTNGLVHIGHRTSAKNRQTALSINTNCLTRLGGCDTVADLLPTVWKLEGDKIVCIVPNGEGFVQKPAGWPR